MQQYPPYVFSAFGVHQGKAGGKVERLHIDFPAMPSLNNKHNQLVVM